MKKIKNIKDLYKKINKVVLIHLLFLLLVVAMGVIGYIRYWNVAVVNGVAINRIDYIKYMDKQAGKQILDSMISDTLVLNEGQKNGINVDQKTIDDKIVKIEEQLKSQNQTLDEALLSSGMTKADLEKQLKMQEIETVLSATKTEITQAQIDEFLNTYKSVLPTEKTKTELQALAVEQLTAEASKSAATIWLNNLRQSAKIIYR